MQQQRHGTAARHSDMRGWCGKGCAARVRWAGQQAQAQHCGGDGERSLSLVRARRTCVGVERERGERPHGVARRPERRREALGARVANLIAAQPQVRQRGRRALLQRRRELVRAHVADGVVVESEVLELREAARSQRVGEGGDGGVGQLVAAQVDLEQPRRCVASAVWRARCGERGVRTRSEREGETRAGVANGLRKGC
eukprot:2901789-Prymnesium_polylepis.1